MKHEGDWRPVFHHKDDWYLRRSAAVCRDLKCGAPVSVNRRTEPSDRYLWMIVFKCNMFGSGLRECAQSVYNSSVLDLTCSGLIWFISFLSVIILLMTQFLCFTSSTLSIFVNTG